MRSGLVLACLAFAGALHAQPAQKNPHTSPADVELGGRLYRGRCGHCHGLEGEGGRGSVLNSGQFRRGGTDAELFQVIRRGIPNTEMPGAFNLPDHEIWRMVAYVQQLGRRGAPEPVTGDAAAGALVFQRTGCATCHSVDGKGGFLGQDLTDVGAKRAVWHLRDSIVNPDADIPLDYRSVTVTTKAAQSISGIHLNEDEYSVHLRDLAGNLRSFLKSELREVKLPRKSLMPSYANLPQKDLEDLVAYLASLRPGARTSATELWDFDRLDAIGGHKTTLLGEPRVVDTPLGKAVEFDGVDDAIVIDDHPLAGARAFTLEVLFRPDGGAREQRFLHLNENPASGADAENRMLLELRVNDAQQWFLDSYHQSGASNKALMNKQALHPAGAWYHVATVYDGQELRNYVDGVLQGAFAVSLAPHAAGKTSVGARINRISYFKGAIRKARFTRKALAPEEFLDVKGRR